MANRSIPVLSGLAMLSLGWSLFLATPAMARTFERCDADGDHCVRVKCDHDGDRCWKESEYFKNNIYEHPGRWVCDHDGDRCHYEYKGHKWNPRHWEDERREEH